MGPTIVKDAALLRATTMNHAQLQRIVVPVVSRSGTYLRRTSSSELELGNDEMAAAAAEHRNREGAAILGEALRLAPTAADLDLSGTDPSFDGATTSVVALRREEDGCASVRSGRAAPPPPPLPRRRDAPAVQQKRKHLADILDRALERVANEDEDWSLLPDGGYADDQQQRAHEALARRRQHRRAFGPGASTPLRPPPVAMGGGVGCCAVPAPSVVVDSSSSAAALAAVANAAASASSSCGKRDDDVVFRADP